MKDIKGPQNDKYCPPPLTSNSRPAVLAVPPSVHTLTLISLSAKVQGKRSNLLSFCFACLACRRCSFSSLPFFSVKLLSSVLPFSVLFGINKVSVLPAQSFRAMTGEEMDIASGAETSVQGSSLRLMLQSYSALSCLYGSSVFIFLATKWPAVHTCGLRHSQDLASLGAVCRVMAHKWPSLLHGCMGLQSLL